MHPIIIPKLSKSAFNPIQKVPIKKRKTVRPKKLYINPKYFLTVVSIIPIRHSKQQSKQPSKARYSESAREGKLTVMIFEISNSVQIPANIRSAAFPRFVIRIYVEALAKSASLMHLMGDHPPPLFCGCCCCDIVNPWELAPGKQSVNTDNLLKLSKTNRKTNSNPVDSNRFFNQNCI